MSELKLNIEGMHCGACVNRVTGALERVTGVSSTAVIVGSAVVQYDPAQTSPDQMAYAVTKIGFQASAEKH